MIPEVSVVIPTYKREREVVVAVKSALDQRAVTLEVVVVDDSPEGTARAAVEAIGDPRIRYIKRAFPSGGVPAHVRNEGASLARGTFIEFLDDDDHLAEGATAALVGALERTGAGVAFGYVEPFGDDADVLARQQVYFSRSRRRAKARKTRFDMLAFLLFKETLLVNSSCMIRRECFEKIGGYDAEVLRCEDTDFYLRAIRACGFAYIDRPTVHYRTGTSSLMHDMKDNAMVEASYGVIHSKYRKQYGAAEFYAMKAFAKALR
jgi:glycosyltransferase involved in cell wall biosynthesis